MKICVVLVVNNKNVGEEYAREMQGLGVQLEIVSSVSELKSLLPRVAVNGLLLDVPTLVRASSAEKAFIHDVIQIFPSVRLRWDHKTGTVRTLLYGHSAEGEETLETFIAGQCAQFKARPYRFGDRLDLHLNLLISTDPAAPEHAWTRTVTMNVSRGGFFVYSTDDWENCGAVWMRCFDLTDASPIQADVCWWKEWGKSMNVPGIGVRFNGITGEQLEEIMLLCEQSTGTRG